MVFSSITFIYYFLPLLFLFYFIVPKKLKNFILLIFSLFFYFYGEPVYVLLLILSIVINYFLAILIDKLENSKRVSKEKEKKIILVLSVAINLGILIYFKYSNFLISNINNIFKSSFSLLNIVMPIGISFFTFQTLSYVIDVYFGKVRACHNIIDFSCYVALFPQLVAGPIVRYIDIYKELKSRELSYSLFSKGVKRFILGLAKKVIIANSIGQFASLLIDCSNPSILGYILYGITYALQVYFDFSGYSDMAIGLGNMFGFNFLENFNYPFIAKSITEFWRRWHISLSLWFKDYVYIPLGGNRVSKIKWLRNIFIVWFLTGFWHGASWNFIFWGLYFGVFLVIEKLLFKEFLEKHKIFSHVYTLFIVMVSFILFGISDFNQLINVFKGMLGFSNLKFINSFTFYYLKNYFVILAMSIIFATPIFKFFKVRILKNEFIAKLFPYIEIVFYILLFLLITAFLVDASFNPFLYFRF